MPIPADARRFGPSGLESLGMIRLLRRFMSRGSKSASQSYIEDVLPRLKAGKEHPTLGSNLTPGSAKGAKELADKLVTQGLRPDHTFVDFGCGTLRIGVHLIGYLDPLRYFGLDLDQRLLDLGVEQLPAGLLETKKPALLVISSESIARVAAAAPHWIYSKGVVQHVPPEELGIYFGNISAMAHKQTTIAIGVSRLTDVPVRRSRTSWRHSLQGLEAAIVAAGLAIKTFESRDGTVGMLMLEKA